MSSSDSCCVSILLGVLIVVVLFAVTVGANAFSKRVLGAGLDIFRFPPADGSNYRKNILMDDTILNLAKSDVSSRVYGEVSDPNMLSTGAPLKAVYNRPGQASNATTPLTAYGYGKDIQKKDALSAYGGYDKTPARKTLTSYGYKDDAYALPKPNLSASFKDPSNIQTFIEGQSPLVLPLRQKQQGTDHIRGDVYIEPIKRGWYDTRKTTDDLETGGHGTIFGESGGSGFGQEPLGCGCALSTPLSGKPPRLTGTSEIVRQYSQ